MIINLNETKRIYVKTPAVFTLQEWQEWKSREGSEEEKEDRSGFVSVGDYANLWAFFPQLLGIAKELAKKVDIELEENVQEGHLCQLILVEPKFDDFGNEVIKYDKHGKEIKEYLYFKDRFYAVHRLCLEYMYNNQELKDLELSQDEYVEQYKLQMKKLIEKYKK